MTRNNSKAQLWASRLAQFENSNLSVAQFCQSIDCSVGSFYFWNRKLAKPTPTPSAFLRVQTSIPAPTGIEIKLPSGITICIPLTATNSLAEILEQVSHARAYSDAFNSGDFLFDLG